MKRIICMLLVTSVACAAASCSDDRDASPSPATPAPADPTLTAEMDTVQPLPAPAPGAEVDTVRPGPAPGTEGTASSGASDPAPPGRGDPASDAALPADLRALAVTLVIPVAGVTADRLRDTYTEARGTRVHEAIDIIAARGTPVLSATDGVLLRLFDSRPGGLMVYAMDTTERFILLYGHLDGYAPGLREGMRLRRGQVIGYVGTTGNAPANTPHLHFGILRGEPRVSWSEGEAVNPYPLLRAAPSPERLP